MKDKDSRSPALFLLKIGGATAILAALLHWVEPKKITAALANASPHWIQGATAMVLLTPLLASARLRFFLRATHVPSTYSNCLQATLAGLSLNLVLPARGGDAAKLLLLKNTGPSVTWSALSGAGVLERASDVLALGILGLCASFATSMPAPGIVSLCVILATLTCLALLPKSRSLPLVGEKLSPFAQACKSAYQHKVNLLAGLATSLLFWFTVSSIMACLLKAFDQSLSFLHALTVTPPAILAGIVPVSLWGIGTRDGALAYFLQDFTSPENALAAGFLYTALAYWLLGLLGIPALLAARRKTASVETVTTEP